MNSAILGLVAALTTAFTFHALPEAPTDPERTMSEQEHLMQRVGTWDCTLSVWPGPGEPQTMQATEVDRALGGHLLADFEVDDEAMPFAGHGITSWDAGKQKFVTVWVDSVGPTPTVLEGTYDAETRTITFHGESDMMGQRMKVRQVVTATDADHRTLEMFVTPPDGPEARSMRVEYTRRK